jgi:hypothetical protein
MMFSLLCVIAPCQLCSPVRDGVPDGTLCPAHPVDGSRPRSRARRTYPNDERCNAQQVSPPCACLSCACLHRLRAVPQHMQRPHADFRTPATRRECRAAVATNGVNTGGTAAAAADVLSSLPKCRCRQSAVRRCPCGGGPRPARARSERGGAGPPRRLVPVARGRVGDQPR